MEELKIPHRIYRKYNLFTATAAGDISYDDLYLHVLELMSDAYFKPGINGLYDFTRVTSLSGSMEKWEALAEGMSNTEIIPEKAKTSIVLPKGNEELLQVMTRYLEMAAGSQIEYLLFDEQHWPQAMRHVEINTYVDISELERANPPV